MKKFSWKKLMSLVLVAALVVGSMLIKDTKAQAESFSKTEQYGESEDAQFTLYGSVDSKDSDATDVTLDFTITDNKGETVHHEGQYRNPVIAVSLVVDRSISIENNGYKGQIITAANDFLSSVLEIDGSVAQVVTYAKSVDTPTAFTSDYSAIKISSLSSNNNMGTNTGEAMDTAYKSISNYRTADNKPADKKIIVLLSDGCPNVTNKQGNVEGSGGYTANGETYANGFIDTIKNDEDILIITIPFVKNSETDAKNFLKNTATSPEYCYTADKDKDQALLEAVAAAKVEIQKEYDDFFYAEDKKLSFELSDYFVLPEDAPVDKDSNADPFVELEDDKHVSKLSYKLILTKTANELAKDFDIVNGKITIPAVNSAEVTYTFLEEEAEPITIGELTVDLALKNWVIDYHVEVLDEESKTVAEQKLDSQYTEYVFAGKPDYKLVDKEAGINNVKNVSDLKLGEGVVVKDDWYNEAVIVEKSNGKGWDVTYNLKSESWSVEYYVDDDLADLVEVAATTYCDETFEVTEDDVKKPSEFAIIPDLNDEDWELSKIEKPEEGSTTWVVKYTFVSPVVNYFIGDATEPFATKEGEDVKFDENGKLLPLAISELGDYDEADFKPLTANDVVKVPDAKIWNVTFTKKGTTNWFIKYTLDGEVIVEPKSVAELRDDEKFNVNDYAKKLSQLGLGYTEIADGVVTTNIDDPTEDAPTTYTVNFTTKTEDFIVKYVVDGSKVADVTVSDVKYDLSTGKVGIDIAEFKVPVTRFNNEERQYKAEDYPNPPVVSGPVKTADVTEYTITYTKKEIKEDPIKEDPTPDPRPSFTPDEPSPTPDPTPIPTEIPQPTPTEAPVVEIEETETPEGDVEIEEIETPEGAPEEEEELEVEPIDTPQGDLPQTGVASSAVFFGIGAACVLFGGVVVLKNRRKEEM